MSLTMHGVMDISRFVRTYYLFFKLSIFNKYYSRGFCFKLSKGTISVQFYDLTKSVFAWNTRIWYINISSNQLTVPVGKLLSS